MKKHQLKTFVLKVLDFLPTKMGFYLYYKIQAKSFKSINKFIEPNLASYEKIKSILFKNDVLLKDKTIIEIGSGWIPLLPYFLKVKGNIDEVYTYDINRHYQQKNLDKCFDYISTNYKTDINLKIQGSLNLPEFIKYHPFTNIIHADMPVNVDIVFSRFVLEHINPEDLISIHKKLFDTLPAEAYILHLISPSDHRAYNDQSLSLYDFLKYSKKEWNKIQTKFDYHNRFRLPNYLEIFTDAGFEIIYVEYDNVNKNEDKYKKFKELKIHSDFSQYSEEELLAGSINVLLKKKTEIA